MKLIAYVEDGRELDIRPGQANRAWMDTYVERFAYGCLPMMMANQHGWDIHAPVGFTVVWNGGDNKDCLAVLQDEGEGDIISHFGTGIFSYRLPALFVTEPGYSLAFQGPPNFPVHGATPLSGMVETDWLKASVGMHWKLTEPGKAVRFQKGDPICHLYPVRRTDIESFEPEKRLLSEEPQLDAYMKDWSALRSNFNAALKDPDSPERKMKWPGHYRRGADLYGNETAPDTHRTKLRLKPFDASRSTTPKKDGNPTSET